jgi:predicted ATP-grasp superfamily ATP-dependent carboligase
VNLLVTNTRNAQAYAIIRALRPHADKIVASMEGSNRLTARLSHAANSRLVDKRYYTPSPARDWRAGRIQKENTESEEGYIQTVLMICEKEKIDTIFPSFDPHVYVFSKNKERFEKKGVLIPIPDYETVITPLDKYRTICAAQEVGFPCPRTYLPESEDDVRRIGQQVGFPLVVKPRFTSAGWGTELVTDFSQLLEKTSAVRDIHGMPIIQEYIPGRRGQDWYVVLNKQGHVKVAIGDWNVRNFFRLNSNLPTVTETTVVHSHLTPATTLVRRLGWWGGVAVQTKIDARDGVPKLMEINPRLGRRLWRRVELGINEPLMCVKIVRGEEFESINRYPLGVVLIDPVEDAIGVVFNLLDLVIYKLRVGVLGKVPVDPFNPPMTLKELIQAYKKTYFTGKKMFNPYFIYFFQDPLVSLLWWCQFSLLMIGSAAKQLGR